MQGPGSSQREEGTPPPAQEEPAEACPSTAESAPRPGNPMEAGEHGGGAVMKDSLGGCGPELRGPWPWPLRVGTWPAWG